ncbi:MAG TPA: hypothetical protein VGH34_12990 [Vicinamibacterales bacterium]
MKASVGPLVTVTGKAQLLECAAASVTEQVTDVEPIVNTVPLAGEQVGTPNGEVPPDTAGNPNETIASLPLVDCWVGTTGHEIARPLVGEVEELPQALARNASATVTDARDIRMELEQLKLG